MAPGPLPKLPEQRARRNAPQRGEWQELYDISEPTLPELPELDGDVWSKRTLRLYDGWRYDPASSLFGPSEIAMTVEAAHIYEKAVREKNASMLNTATAWMDRLGLTPKGKRDLRLRVVRQPKAPVVKIAPPLED